MSKPTATANRARAPAKAPARAARAKPQPAKRTFAAPAFAAAEAVLQGGGQPLEPNLRAHMERAFGHDFGAVRVHCDSAAHESAHALGARAYAVGRHLVFDRNEYRPAAPEGQRLLAHELAHVVQQGPLDYRADRPLQLESGDSALEREAHRAADAAPCGDRVHVSHAADTGVQRLQRAEHGTYVSTIGSSPYLDAGEQFYRTWGHPNVKRVAHMGQVLDDLDTATNPIESFRIVSHGSSLGLELGLLPEIASDYFWAQPVGDTPAATRYTTESGFRKEFANKRILVESKFVEIYNALWKDAATQALLTTLGGAKDPPNEESNLGIVLRAIADERFLADVELADGGKPDIPNKAALQAFIKLRRDTYGKLLVEAKPKDEQADAKKAIADLGKKLPAVMAAARISFGKIDKDEAKTFADDFVETPGKRSGLKKSFTRSIREGAGGPFLKRLRSVRSKINGKTQIEIRGCNVGKDAKTMEGLRAFFGNPDALPALSAPDLFQFFFQLNVKSYHKDEEADLEAAYGDSRLGIQTAFEDLRRMKAGEVIRLHVGGKLDDLAKKYGFDASKARRFTPEIEKFDELKEGDLLWLVQREVVPLGRHKSLDDFCQQYLGNRYLWPKVLAVNPGIGDPKLLGPGDRITVPRDLLGKPFAAVGTGKNDFVAAVRGGEAVAGLASAIDVKQRTRRGVVTTEQTFARPRPVLHIDDARRNEALGKWLAAQKFDPKGRTAAELSKRFGKSEAQFETGRAGTYVQFLTRGYPNAVDPIFPEDPRYDSHIIRQP